MTTYEKIESDKCCRFLERVCNHKTIPFVVKRFITDEFLKVKSLEELHQLCNTVMDWLESNAANPGYFTVG